MHLICNSTNPKNILNTKVYEYLCVYVCYSMTLKRLKKYWWIIVCSWTSGIPNTSYFVYVYACEAAGKAQSSYLWKSNESVRIATKTSVIIIFLLKILSWIVLFPLLLAYYIPLHLFLVWNNICVIRNCVCKITTAFTS